MAVRRDLHSSNNLNQNLEDRLNESLQAMKAKYDDHFETSEKKISSMMSSVDRLSEAIL